MLRIKKVKKYRKPLGFPAGKEIRIKQLGNPPLDFTSAPVYVKFGRELSKHPNPDASMAWNVSLFDTALNHPQRPWTVRNVAGANKPLVLAVKEQGLVGFEENSNAPKNVRDADELTGDEYRGTNSSINFVSSQGKDFVVALEETHLTSFEVKNSNGQLLLHQWGMAPAYQRGALPVVQQDGTTGYVLVNNGVNSGLHTVDGRGLQPKKTPLQAQADAVKVLMTKNNEVLHISSQGLNTYGVSGTSTNFKYYCPFFSGLDGWSQQFIDSIQLMKTEGNQEGLIATGPKGIEFFKLSNECKSYVVKEHVPDSSKAKYALVASATPKVNNEFKVLGYYDSELYVITLRLEEATKPIPEWKEPQNTKQPGEKVKATASSRITVRGADKSRKTVRWLRDSIDEAAFKNIVDKVAGKVKFSFPLIDMQDRMGLPIKLMVYYEEAESEEMGVLGRHWTLGKDCIVLQHHNTVFEEEHEYYLVKDQMKIRLERDWGNSSGGGVRFNIKGIQGVTLEYRRSEEKWVVKNSKVVYTYGINNRGVVAVTGWDNWNGPSKNLNGKQQLAVEWNLVEIASAFDEKVKISYQYSRIDPSTNSMHLDSISDNDKTKISFTYTNMSTRARKVESITVNEHTFTNTKLLKEIQIDTPSYTQNLLISTKIINNLHYLEGIKQVGDENPVLYFQYNTENQLMPKIAQIDLPSKSILKFSYSNQTIETSQFQQELDEYSDLYSGMEYSLLLRKNPDETTVTITTKDSAGRNDFVDEQKMEINAVPGHKVKNCVPFMKSNYFAVVVDYNKGEETSSKIYIFNRGEDKKMQADTKQRNADRKLPRYDFQEDSFTYYNSGSIHFEYRSNSNSAWIAKSQQIGKTDLITIINRGAVYFTDKLYLVRWDLSGKLMQKTLSESNDLPKPSDIDSLFKHIDVQGTDPNRKEEAEKEVKQYIEDVKATFNNYGLMVYNNLVALRTVLLTTDGKLSIKLFLYLLNTNYEPSQRYTLPLEGEDINKFVLDLDVYDKNKARNINDLFKYQFKFQKTSSKYKLTFIEAKDKSGTKIQPSEEHKQNMQYYERQLKIPLDFEKYMIQVNQDGLILRNQQIYHSDGKFVTEPMNRDTLKLTKFSFPMGAFSTLKKEFADDMIKLCTQTEQQGSESCVSLESISAHNVSIKYPYFLVVQKRHDIKVLPLKMNSRGWEDLVEYKKETARASTSHTVLVTTKVADNKTMIRPMRSLNKDQRAYVQVVQLEQLSTPYEEYQIKYEYGDPSLSMNDFAFKRTSVIPGGDKKAFGYFKETNDLKTNQQVVQVMTADDQVFDPEYVKRMNEMQKEEEKQREPAKLDEEQAIMDKAGNHVILKTIPYLKQQNLVHFIGFEDYEDFHDWSVRGQTIYNSIHRNEFSATGRNFLLLRRGETLEREFRNIPYFDSFIASAWVRTTHDITVGSPTDIISIYVSKQQIQGEIKQSINDWIYVEATTKSIPVTSSNRVNNVQIKVVLSANSADLHVDHVRLSPMNFNLEANVYDSKVGKRTAQIHNNGRISRRLFDAHSRRIGEVDEYGNVKFLTSYSKRTGLTKPAQGSKVEGSNISRIQIKPKLGWVEDFSPYNIEKRWSFASGRTKLEVEPGMISLQGKLSSICKFSGDSICVRLIYNITDNSSIILQIGKTSITINKNAVSCKRQSKPSPSSAELIVFTTPKFTTIWIDGQIIIEASESNTKFSNEIISLEVKSGSVEIRDLIIMEDAEAHISYMNRDYKPLQEILLQDSANILIRQMIYDALGRKEIETVWTQKSINAEPTIKVLQYQAGFVQNDNPSGPDYFQKTGYMSGSVATFNPTFKGYPYSQITYYRNPLEVRHKIGQPGQDYSINGRHVHEYSIESDIPFIKHYYPKHEGYRHEQEKKPNGMIQVTVYNRRNKKVAEYIQVKDYNNILTTYVYDQHGNQIQMVPPKYYEEQSKNQRGAPFKPEKTNITSPWVVSSEYDQTGELIVKKITPDGGRVDFLYNEFNQLRYQLHYAENNQVDKIAYFLYNVFGRVSEAGQLPANPDMVRQVHASTRTHEAIPSRDYSMYS